MPESYYSNTAKKALIESLRERFELKISLIDSHLLKNHSIKSYIDQLDQIEHRVYNFFPSEISLLYNKIESTFGLHILDSYHRLLLLSLIELYDDRRSRYRITESIHLFIHHEFDRILSNIETMETGYFIHTNDLFVKDLGICRLKLLPLGAELVDIWAGVPRSTLLNGGISQIIQAGLFIARRVGGFRPLYEYHWDRRLVRYFNEHEYDLCYMRLAELLELNPAVKGLFGASWWYDPKIEEIAPELLFLQRVPIENGARVFHVGSDPEATKDALIFSKKRKLLYEAGKFRPSRYMLVWARHDILNWAKAKRFVQSENPVTRY